MSYDVVQGGLVVSRVAGETLAANRVVVLDSTQGQVIYPDHDTDTPFGVTLEGVDSGQHVAVVTGSAIVKIRTANAVAANARVSISGTSGDIDDAADGTVSTKYVGLSLEASSEGGVEIPVAINLPGVCEDGGAS